MVHYDYEIRNRRKGLKESFQEISLKPAVMNILLCSAILHTGQDAQEGSGRYLLMN